MKIIELRAENFKRLRAVSIRPSPNGLVQITGANGAGKTSVLDAIWVALRGRAVADPQPIRRGAEKATISLNLGEMTVIREFKAGADGEITTSLRVTLPDGSRIQKTPQAVLDALVGDLAFDPLEFARADQRRQRDMLKSFVKGFDLDASDAKIAQLTEQRRAAHRALTAADGAATTAASKLPPGPKPARRDVSAAIDRLQEAGKHNAAIETRRARRDAATAELDRLLKLAAALRAQLNNAEPLPEPIDTDALRASVSSAEAHNKVCDLHEESGRLEAAARTRRAEHEALDADLKKAAAHRAEAITSAALPAGLTIGEDGVALNGLPLSQASHAERLAASVAVAMAANPKLRVIRTCDGSLLDNKSLAMIERLAAERDYQVWIERVDERGEVGIHIDDGMIVETAEAATSE